MLNNRVLITAFVSSVFIGIGCFGFLRCSRDNPVDPKSNNYVPGTPPMAGFKADTVSCLAADSVNITVTFSDTQGLGGKPPAVTRLYFNWDGGTSHADSAVVTGQTDSMTVRRAFPTARNVIARVWALDNDNTFSPADSMRLIVRAGVLPEVNFSEDTIACLITDSIRITVAFSDTQALGGKSPALRTLYFNWAGDSNTLTDSVAVVGRGAVDTLTVMRSFLSVRDIAAYVRVRDNDGLLSPAGRTRLIVRDTIGPEVSFWSHHDGDSVIQPSPTITLMVRTRDPSGVLTLWINGASGATRLVDTTWPEWQTWQQNVTLTEGSNTVTVWSWDKSSGSNMTRDSIRLFYRRPDVTPPAVVFSIPPQGDTVRDTLNPSPVTVIVSVSDPSGVAWVRCNGIAMSNTSGSNYQLDVMLNEGSDSLVITAADTKTNSKADTLFITYLVLRDITPPTMRIVSPTPGRLIAADSVMVIVYAYDTSGPVKSGIASLTVNGVLASYNYVHYMAIVPLVHGYDTLRAVAVDSSGNQRRDSSVIVIHDIPPRFVPDVQVKDTTLWLDSLANIPICASDTEGDSMSFAFVTYPTKGALPPTIDTAGPGCARIAAYRPISTGLDTFRVRVVDAFGAADTLKVAITIIPRPTTKPYFTISTLPDTAILDSLYSVQLTAIDPQGLPLVYSLLPPPPAGVLIDTATGLVTWTPAVLGSDSIRAVVRNTIPEADTLAWPVVVVLRDMPPVLQNPGDRIVDEGQLLQFNLAASDTNGDSLVYSFGSTYPAGATMDSLGGVFTWTPTYQQGGVPPTTYPTVLKVTEKNRNPALSDSVTIVIGVKDTNMPPVLVNPGNRTVNEGSALTFPLQATDINGDSIFFSISGAPKDSGAVIAGNTFTWTPSVRAAGVYPITYIATDNGSPVMRDSVTDTITVVDATVPVFDLHPPVDTILVGFPYVTTVSAADGDNDSLTYKKLAGPDSLFVGGKSGVVLYLPKRAVFNDLQTVSITAQDHAGNIDTLTWQLLVARWPRITLSPASYDTGFSVIQTRDGGYALCGSISDTTGKGYSVGFFMMTDPSGNMIDSIHSFPGNEGHVKLYSLQQTPDGGFIMCGTDSSVTGQMSKLLFVRTDPAGQTMWTQTYSDIDGKYQSAKGTCVGLTADGGFIACGAVIRGPGLPTLAPAAAYLIKTGSDGLLEWQKIYSNGPLSVSAAFSVQETRWDNGFVVCGSTETGTMGKDAYLVKADKMGDTLWTKMYARPGNEVALSVAAVGGAVSRPYYVVGGYVEEGSMSITKRGSLMKVDEFGDTLGGGWVKLLSPGSAVTSVKQTLDNDFIACGIGVNGGGNSGPTDVLLCRFGTDGSLGPLIFHGANLDDGGFCVAPASDGGFILTGFATTYLLGWRIPTTDICLLKTDRDGALELQFGSIH